MADLRTIKLDTFAGLVGERFTLSGPELPALELELVDAASLGDAPAEGVRAPFMLLFRGAVERIAPQGVYAVAHDTTGELELFVVPLEPDSGGARYQVIFN